MKSFNSYSFGCRVNKAEIETLENELFTIGYSKKEKNPEIFIINTCSVTHKAEREARNYINGIKRSFPDTKIIVTGCAATNWIKLNTKVKGVDFLVDNTQKSYLAEIIDKKYSNISIKKSKSPAINNTSSLDIYQRSKRIMIKMQDGCHRFCNFCIVPYLRGLPKSISIKKIVNSINAYPDFSEAILTAINTEAYGRDTDEAFVDLIKSVLKHTNIPRISFGSIHPWSINDDFLKLYSKISSDNRFVDFFHIPLQSGSNKILRLMKRGYTREEFIEKLNAISNINPFAFIGTDVIVGYLEENEHDFEDTYSFLEQTPVSRFHVFRFSKRQHTAAYYMSKRLNEPSANVKKTRSKALRLLSEQKFQKFQEKHINQIFEALFLEKRENDCQYVVLNNQMSALIASEKDYTGEIKRVTIKSFRNGILFGTIR